MLLNLEHEIRNKHKRSKSKFSNSRGEPRYAPTEFWNFDIWISNSTDSLSYRKLGFCLGLLFRTLPNVLRRSY